MRIQFKLDKSAPQGRKLKYSDSLQRNPCSHWTKISQYGGGVGGPSWSQRGKDKTEGGQRGKHALCLWDPNHPNPRHQCFFALKSISRQRLGSQQSVAFHQSKKNIESGKLNKQIHQLTFCFENEVHRKGKMKHCYGLLFVDFGSFRSNLDRFLDFARFLRINVCWFPIPLQVSFFNKHAFRGRQPYLSKISIFLKNREFIDGTN